MIAVVSWNHSHQLYYNSVNVHLTIYSWRLQQLYWDHWNHSESPVMNSAANISPPPHN